MANESRRCGKSLFKGLNLPEKAFKLPSISSPWLSEEPIINHDISDQMELESHPTSILDGSCMAEVMNKPSIPLVESVESFGLGHFRNPVDSSVKANVDLPIDKCEGHDLQPHVVGNAKSFISCALKGEESHDNICSGDFQISSKASALLSEHRISGF